MKAGISAEYPEPDFLDRLCTTPPNFADARLVEDIDVGRPKLPLSKLRTIEEGHNIM